MNHLLDQFGSLSKINIAAIHDAFERGEFGPLDLLQACISEAKKRSDLNAFITLTEDLALKSAEEAQKWIQKTRKVPREKQPLFGIPIGIKDILVTEGVRTTCASQMLKDYVPPYTATCVSRLQDSGAIIVGKLNMDEFAMGGSNENSAFGPVRHPTHPDRVAGGSSGGSAAAVRAGLCVASLGTDTGGSIRLPASFCGVVGFKPTYSRISRFGLIAFASSFDQIGPFANSVEDAALLLDIMSGQDPRDSTCAPLPATQSSKMLKEKVDWSSLRIGIPKEYFVEGISPGVEKAVRNALAKIEAKGARIIPISLPHTEYSVAVYYIVAVSEASSNLARFDGIRFGTRPTDRSEYHDLIEYYRHARALFGAEVKRRIILGTFSLSSGYSQAFYQRACQVRSKVKNDFTEAFQQVDLIAGPVCPTSAFRLGELTRDPLQMYLNDILTIPANLAGLPGLSVPCGQDEQGLPVGLQLIGPAFQDERLLSVANAIEKEMV